MPRVADRRVTGWGDFPPDFTSEVLRLTLRAWDEFVLPDRVKKEPHITALFTQFLEDYIYEDETKDWAAVDDKKYYDVDGKEVARPDICIFPQGNKHRDFAFVFECKRLNVVSRGRTSHGAAAYTGSGGMMCFVSGKYAQYVREGGMLGYVMNGDLTAARNIIHRYIDRRRDELRLALMTSLSFCSHLSHLVPNPHGETRHEIDGRSFILYHLLVPVRRAPTAAPLRQTVPD